MRFSIVQLLSSSLCLSSLATAIATSGCGKDLPASQSPAGGASHSVQFKTSDGTTRNFLVHIPSNYKKTVPVPLIFSFHGRTKTASEQEGLSQFSNETWNPNAIAVYPQGLQNQWQGDPSSVGVNDTLFVHDMIANFSSIYCLNSSRIYAAGKSNGGGFTNLLACDPTLSKQIAAYAPVSGAYYVNTSSDGTCSPETVTIPCNPGRFPIPILEFHGNADTTIPYGGGLRRGKCLPTIPHWVREWSKRDGYGLSNVTTDLYGGKVQKYEYGKAYGKQGIVTHYLIQNLTHSWPSTQPNDDSSTPTVLNATPLIMDFFNKYSL